MRSALFTLMLLAGAASAAPQQAATSAYDSAFAGYQPFREPALKLAGRDTVKPADPHAGHGAHGSHDAPAADPHAGHAMHRPAPKADDPHAGHAMQQPAAKPADPHAGHEGHEHHQHKK